MCRTQDLSNELVGETEQIGVASLLGIHANGMPFLLHYRQFNAHDRYKNNKKYIKKIIYNNNNCNNFIGVMTKLNNKYAESNHKNAVQSHQQHSTPHRDDNSKAQQSKTTTKMHTAPLTNA